MNLSPWLRWAVLLGFALGGFFDGILLHQVLQWHHFLSLVPGSGDLPRQVLWDGLFHLATYVLSAVALVGLWRTRGSATDASSRRLSGALAIGFGLWNVVDVAGAHWVLGIHRIRVDVSSPLLWDLGWLAVFGLLPLLVGLALFRGSAPPPRLAKGGAATASALLCVFATGAAVWASRPPPDQPFTTVTFGPNVSAEAVMTAVAAADARLVWSDPTLRVIVVEVSPERRLGFYRRGALLVGGSGLAGCADWVRVAT